MYFFVSVCYAQVPGIKWQKTFGGSQYDIIYPHGDTGNASRAKTLIPIADGGFIIAGSTFSANGDIENNHGATDIWVARLDSARNTIWKKCYGGTGYDYISNIIQTGNDEFIFAGISGNPVKIGSLYVSINSAKTANSELKLINMQGKVILTDRKILYPGNNILLLPDMANLSSGIYTIQVIAFGEVIAKSFNLLR